MHASRILSSLVVLGSLLPGRPQGAPQGDSPEIEALRTLGELAARDERVSFSRDSAWRARALLEGGEEEVEPRAVAVVAVGCGGSAADLPRLEASARTGALPERRAALLALGALGSVGLPSLEGILGGDVSNVEEALCLGLLLAERAGAPEAGKRLEALAGGAYEALARRARLVLQYRAGGLPPDLHDTLGFWFELRWRAARLYGFVDGLRGPRATAAELFEDEEFLDRVVFTAAAELSPHELGAHMAEILAGGERVGALRVAAVHMPDLLVRAHEAGLWRPSLEAWSSILDEIDAKRAEGQTQEILKLAYKDAPELEFESGRLLVRAGADLPWSWVRERLESGPLADRMALLEACGERGEKARIPELAEILARRDAQGLDGVGRVALARLGHPPSQTALRDLLAGPASLERDRAVTALARVLHDRSLRPFAGVALRNEDLTRGQRFELLVALARGGAPVDLADVRAALLEARTSGVRRACVAALAAAPEAENIAALAALFPVDGDLDLDVELALALLQAHHPNVSGLLRSALWSRDWNRSVLAGGLILNERGSRGLVDEIDNAPRTASEHDLRRVGFSLGEWGGLGAVEDLSRNHFEDDPALQGALLGALASRSGEEVIPRKRAPVDFQLGTITAKPPSLSTKSQGAGGRAGGRRGAGRGGGGGGRRRRPF